jgi:Dolichyl-phosphate-mannose-protein mannosyltransferase
MADTGAPKLDKESGSKAPAKVERDVEDGRSVGGPKNRILTATAIVVLLLGLRVFGLASYPAAMPDEGFWASGPRNWVLFDHPLLDNRLHSFLSPATFAALSVWFSIFAPSLTSARCFSVLTGLLSCAAIGIIGQRCFARRGWWLPAFYGVSGLSVFIDRTILIESHQIFWLILAATLWLAARPASGIASGAAFGLALLVKINSLYLVPAFCLSAPRREGESNSALHPLLSFLLAAALVAASGYLGAWALDPMGFVTAFRFEVHGAHLVSKHVLFHYGRAGLNPHLLAITARETLFADPFVTFLGIAGMIWVLARFRSGALPDRFFACWAASGLLYHLVHIYPQYRYVTTTAPALAYLGIRLVIWGLDCVPAGARPVCRTAKVLVGAVAATCVGYQMIQVGVNVSRRANAPYWRLVKWVSKHVPREANMLAAPYIGVSLPNRSYDFGRLIYGYNGVPVPLERIIVEHEISRVVVDGQWKKYQNANMKHYLATQCAPEATIASFQVFTCPPTGERG